MLTIFNQQIAGTYNDVAKVSLIHKFTAWTEAQENNRLLWLGIAIAGHGCVLAPISLFIIMFTGFQFGLFMTVMGAMAAALIVNLAAMPTKITIPVFFASIIADLVAITVAVTIGIIA
jgi:hypothetical protein